MKRTFYTTAPEAYDWGQVVESQETDLEDERGQPIRRIVIDEDVMGGVSMQLERYGSGLHPAWEVDSENWAKAVSLGYIREKS